MDGGSGAVWGISRPRLESRLARVLFGFAVAVTAVLVYGFLFVAEARADDSPLPGSTTTTSAASSDPASTTTSDATPDTSGATTNGSETDRKSVV